MSFPLRYSLYGASFGLCFPVLATPIAAWQISGEITLMSIAEAQLQNSLLWMINTAPLFLGLFACYAGRQYEKVIKTQENIKLLNNKLAKQNQTLEHQVQERTEVLEINLKKLITANQVKSDFVATVSHELRTPLTAIGGAIKLIKSNKLSVIEKPVMDLIELADKNVNQLNSLINDILDTEKMESGKIELDIRSHNVASLIKQSVEMNKPYADSYSVKLKCADIDSSLSLNLDKHRFIQVMQNLISNACKFSPRGSQVSISAIQAGNCIRINVSDQGNGIPEEMKDKIFDKFTQIDSSSNRARGGTGLGLNITRSLVESMGGTIGFSSNNKTDSEDGGTVFHIDFLTGK